jgi:hypothetical protein
MLSTSHERIIAFYENNPHIEFEKANIFLIDIFELMNNKKDEEKERSFFMDSIHKFQDELHGIRDQLKHSSQYMLNLQTSVTDLPTHIHHLRDNYTTDLERVLATQKEQQQDGLLEKMNNMIGENVKNTLTSDKLLSGFNASLTSKCDYLQQLMMTTRETEVCNRESLQAIHHHFDRQKKSTLKGIDSETKVEGLLNHTFSDACIENTTGKAKSCDFMILRHEKPTIMIENKEYSNNVPIVEVEKFIRDIEHHNHSGILISQSSGIARKQNFQIDIHNGSVLIYIHHLEYDFDKVRLAVHTIDYIKTMLKDFHYEEEDFKVSMDTLKALNKEYQQLLFQRNSMTETLKEFNKSMGKQIQALELGSLSNMMSKHFSSTEAKFSTCSYCKRQFKNVKALAGHTKKCKKVREEEQEQANIVIMD